jgi:hypothetical protein
VLRIIAVFYARSSDAGWVLDRAVVAASLLAGERELA